MVVPAFHKFTSEAAIISRLLAGYAELEIDLLHWVAVPEFNDKEKSPKQQL
jgi:hypothetical protein